MPDGKKRPKSGLSSYYTINQVEQNVLKIVLWLFYFDADKKQEWNIEEIIFMIDCCYGMQTSVFQMFEVGDTGTSTCLLIFENLLRFNQPILINWVPGSMGWAYVQQRTKKINKHEYLILNLGWHLLRSNKRHLTYNLNLLNRKWKCQKSRIFSCPKYTLFFRVVHTAHLFVHLFGARLWTSYFMSRLFKKVFASWPLSDIKKRQRKSSGPRANRTNKKKSNKIGCAHSESLIKTLTMTWN